MSARSHSDTAVTRARPFADVASGVKIFSVQQGVPVRVALEYASCLLETCLTQAHVMAEGTTVDDADSKAWASVYLLESIQALLSSSIQGLVEAKQ